MMLSHGSKSILPDSNQAWRICISSKNIWSLTDAIEAKKPKWGANLQKVYGKLLNNVASGWLRSTKNIFPQIFQKLETKSKFNTLILVELEF